jgi:hypothetical protein
MKRRTAYTLALAGLVAMALSACDPKDGTVVNPNTGETITMDPPAAPTKDPAPKSDLCAAVDAIDPSPMLGNSTPEHRACRPDESTGTLAQAVWTRPNDGVRVSVSVISNADAKNGLGTFQQLFDGVTDARVKRGGITVLGAQHRWVSQAATAGVISIDMGSTYVNVWLSQSGTDVAGGMPIGKAQAAKLEQFATTVIPVIYS